jgi:hypothetical protein
MYAPAPVTNISTDTSKSQTNKVTNTNTQLIANNININTSDTTNIKGATLQATNTLNLNTKNLNISSVQNKLKSNSKSQGASIGFGTNGITSAGVREANSRTTSKQTVQTSLTGETVNIKVNEHTNLKAATITSVDTQGKDNNKLTLTTNTLNASSLNNTHNSNSKSLGVSVGETVSLDYSNDKKNSKTKVLATIGSGDIQIANKEDSNTKMLNTDVANNEVDIYNVESHKGLSGKLDTRLLTKNGQKKIKDDIITSSAITNAIEQIATTDKAGLKDFFDEVKKNVDVYEGMKKELSQNPVLAKQLQDPNLTPQQKQQMLQTVANTVKKSLGYEVKDNDLKLVSTDKKGANDAQFKGHYNDGQTFINDKNNDSTKDLLTTLGHETQHNMDDQEQIHKPQDIDQNNYATNFGEDLSFYTSNALDQTYDKEIASTNTHNSGQTTSNPSVFNDATFVVNNVEFDKVDTSKGDDVGVTGALIGGGLTLAGQISPEIAKQYYQEDKNIFEMDYKKIYEKVDIVDVGIMSTIGFFTPNEFSSLTSSKNIMNSVNQYRKYNKLVDKTNKNLNKKIRFDNKANENVNTIVKEIGVQTFIFAGKELLKESNDKEEKENE